MDKKQMYTRWAKGSTPHNRKIMVTLTYIWILERILNAKYTKIDAYTVDQLVLECN